MKNTKKLTSLVLSSALLAGPLFSNQAFAAATTFTDISNSYAKNAILELANAGIVNGVGGEKFNPLGLITRQEFAIILAKALKLDVAEAPAKATFKDVPATNKEFAYIEAAVRAGLIKGYSNGEFKGSDLLSREQMAVLFVRALGVDAAGYGEKIKFSDANQIAAYAKDAVGFAVEAGLIKGIGDNTFAPGKSAQRQEVALVASKFITVKTEQNEKKEEAEKTTKPAPAPVPAPTPVPDSTPTPSPGASLLTPPEVNTTVTREKISFSFEVDTAWTSKISGVSVKFKDGESRELPLEMLDFSTGKLEFPPISTGDTLIVTIKATGYKDKVITLQGPAISSEVGITIDGFIAQTIEDQTILVGQAEEAVTVGTLKDWIASKDNSEQTYEVFGESLMIPLDADGILDFGKVYTVTVISEDGKHNKDYKVMIKKTNQAPIATNVMISGTAKVGQTLTGSYVYSDVENDDEGATEFKWYRANDASGVGKTVISEATSETYTLVSEDAGKYIIFEVTPVVGTGITKGSPVKSAATIVVAPAADLTITFKANQFYLYGNSIINGDVVVNPGIVIDDDVVIRDNGEIVAYAKIKSTNMYEYEFYNFITVPNKPDYQELHDIIEIEYGMVGDEKVAYITKNDVTITKVSPSDVPAATNQAPTVTNVTISGTAEVGQTLTGSYVYSDVDGDSEGAPEFKWYRADDEEGTNKAVISGANTNTYTLVSEDAGKYISFEVTPVAGTGSAKGLAVTSNATGAVAAEASTTEPSGTTEPSEPSGTTEPIIIP
ncbi:S-layer homology domain-containing protein [Paenibacillus sp. YPG26]|uniref:S-layer homology domain-containing protein n=1 Tax=Paenibacillus sp. YPG26 TaxID=2878915 RepID=UPI0020417C1E|nr:S-layer homology domain-containing protein [Paenibacillus sp. YPG26]USB32669.1 S-layer homology domain-containing protein [Paenibacillus sp. YPG26]